MSTPCDEVTVRKAKNGVIITPNYSNRNMQGDPILVIGDPGEYQNLYSGDVGKAVLDLLYGDVKK